MYLPEMFAVADPEEIDQVLADLRLGCLVTRDESGFFGSHIPMHFDPAKRVLTGHISNANPHPARSGDGEAFAVFQGLNAYVTPNWYPSKFRHGQTVPTWNYEVVHVDGKLTWRHDRDWLRAHLTAVTDHFERDQAKPWALSDAPEDYIERLLGLVVGFEFEARGVQVKRKFSQNRAEGDRLGVIAGLLSSDDPAARSLGETMAKPKPK